MSIISAPIKVSTDVHEHIRQALVARIHLSKMHVEDKLHPRLEKADKDFVFHMPEKTADSVRRAARKGGIPQYTTLEVPFTYAMMMTAHTYLSSVFLSRTPVIQFEAASGGPEMNRLAIEALMHYQTTRGLHLPVYYSWLHDPLRYGVGICGNYWEEEVNRVSRFERRPVLVDGVPVQDREELVRVVRDVKGYAGTRLFNIRPHDYLPDPRVPLNRPQAGEFQGWKTDIQWATFLQRAESGQYIKENLEAVKKLLKGRPVSQREDYIVEELDLPPQEDPTHTSAHIMGSGPSVEMVVNLIPKDWKLGTTTTLEKWVFTIVDEKIIVEARPLGTYCNKFPAEVLEIEFDPYTFAKRGLLEIGRPLNEVVTWLFNSHFYSVRKTLNGDIIYDPSRVMEKDLLNSSGTGSRVRIKPHAYGQDVRTMIHQFVGGADVTGTHLRDTEVVSDFMQKVLGINENVMGVLNQGGRKTATEVRTSAQGSITRMKTMAEYLSASGFAPFAQQILSLSQQFYTEEKKFKIAGDAINDPEGFITVDPEAISGEWEYLAVDGTLPLDKFALVNMWTNIFAQVRQMPEILQRYDIGGIFSWVAQLGGLKNIKQFEIRAVPDGQLDPNGVPLNGPGNAQGAGGPERASSSGGGSSPVIPLAQQVPGMGRAG